jgi:inorganic pyrophosphatase
LGDSRKIASFREDKPMGLDLVTAGRDVPDDVNVVIEIPKDAEPVKYEVDKASGAIFVDRVLSTPMRYPCNYGYIPNTLSGDGDPADALVLLPLPLVAGSVIRCRPVGMLNMDDEAGHDTKVVVVPNDKVFRGYAHIHEIADAPQHWRDRIAHFFEHYKDLESGKWVKVMGWGDAAAAREEIRVSVSRYLQAPEKPRF